VPSESNSEEHTRVDWTSQ